MTPETSATGVGSVLGDRYELIRHLAAGRTADVYEGRDRSLRRSVAVKVFRARGPGDREQADAEVATLLEDPVVRVYDAGEWSDAGGYVVVELVDEPALLSSLGDGLRPVHPPTVVGDPVDGDAPTRVVAVGGDTSVMPAVLRPVPPPAADDGATTASGAPTGAAVGAGRALWIVLAAIALTVVVLASQGGRGIDVPTPTTEPVQVTSPPPPTTTAPPTTAEPATERPGKGKGRKHDD